MSAKVYGMRFGSGSQSNERANSLMMVLAVTALIINSLFTYREPSDVKSTVSEPPVTRQETVVSEARKKHVEVAPPLVPTPVAISAPPREREEDVRLRIDAENRVRAERAKDKEREEHGRFLARYINPEQLRPGHSRKLAICAADAENRLALEIGTAILERLGGSSFELSTSFFNPEFLGDGLYARLFNGSDELSEQLELRNHLSGLILAKESVDYTKSPELENVITATLSIEVRVISLDPAVENRSWRYHSAGAGFSNAAARKLAEERISKQMTNIALGLISK